MDDLGQPRAPKPKDEEVLCPNIETFTEGTQLKMEAPAATSQISVSEQLREQKGSRKKASLVIPAIFLMFALVGGAVWFILADNAPQNDTSADEQPSKNRNGNDKKLADKPAPIEKTIALSVDDELVRKLYGYFKNQINFLTYDFYSEDGGLSGNVDERMMAALAFNHMPLSSIIVHKTTQGIECYDARPIRKKAYEIFGKKIELYDGMRLLTGDYPLYIYSKDNDAFCLMGGFGSMLNVHHNLYKAERTDESVSLYVVAGNVDTGGAGQEESFSGVVSRLNSDEKYLYHPTGNENTDIMEYADKLDKFKWTFTKNSDGNYIYTSLERL